MAEPIVKLDALEIAREVKFKVEIRNEKTFGARLWLFMLFVKVAVWVGGFGGVEFVDSEAE